MLPVSFISIENTSGSKKICDFLLLVRVPKRFRDYPNPVWFGYGFRIPYPNGFRFGYGYLFEFG